MKRWVLTALVCAAMLAAAAKADDLILNGAGGWSYMVVPFGQQPGFAASTYDSTGWQVGQGPWGGWETGYAEVCGLNSTIVTAWPNYTDLLLRRSLQLCAGASGLAIDVTVDNDVQVFFNGVDISNGLISRENCAVYGEANATFAVPDALLQEGENILAVRARDRGVISFLDVAVRGNGGDCVEPILTVDCTTAVPSVVELWPPNHKYVPINVQGVLDSDGNEVEITIDSIFQDESVRGGNKTGSGNTCPDGRGLTSDTAWVRAERSGVLSNGRVYEINFTATGAGGEVCQGVVRTCVPHDRGHGLICIDDGALYDSTTCP